MRSFYCRFKRMGAGMMNDRKRSVSTFKKVIVLLIMTISLIIIIKFFIGTKVVIKISGTEYINNVQLFENDKRIFSINEAAKSFTLVNRFGKKRIIIKSPGYEDYQVDFTTYFRGTRVVEASLIEKVASKQAALLDTGYLKADYTIENAKYFGDNLWLAFKLKSKVDLSAEPNSIMAYFHTDTASWEVINYGGEEYEFDTTSATPNIPQPPIELYQEYFQ